MNRRPGGIAFEGVWKKYRRGVPHGNLREAVPALVRRVLSRPAGVALRVQEFWALQDLTLEVKPGEVLGIIGPNGAGKSTVLKLASMILAPEGGRVRVEGRIGALIELAAGFHPDLTGRENVYLQGAMMGMKRAEIGRRFEQIVEFAGVGAFIDTQVKRYSSGMQARLGFAIAANLDADVLLIDEVLSVGDLAFQRKALNRMREIVRGGIPVILVSHQLDRILDLCTHAVFLSQGQVVCAGSAGECVAAYVDGQHLPAAGGTPAPVSLDALDAGATTAVHAGERLHVRLSGRVIGGHSSEQISVGILVRRLPEEEAVFGVHAAAMGVLLPKEGPFELEFGLQMNTGPGAYRLQGFVWHRGERRELARSVSALITVDAVHEVFGRAYLDPRVRVLRP